MPVDPRPNPPVIEDRAIHHAFIIGFEDGYVRPGGHTTRAHAATILFRLMSDRDRARHWAQDNPYHDVGLNNWFNNAVSTATNANIIEGLPGGSFRPHRAITRAEFAAAVVRFMGVDRHHGATVFSDMAGHWAQGYVNAAANHGWITGYGGPGGEFMPDKPITRAETAALINRMLARIPETPEDLLPGMVTWPDNSDESAWYYLYIQEATNTHYYVRKADGVHETWEELLTPRDWTLLERPYSRP